MAKPCIQEVSHETQQLVNCLRTLPEGAVVAYGLLSQAIAKNVQKEGRSCLMSARRILQREEHLVFSAVRGEGIKRLNDSQIALSGGAYLRQVNRASRRGARTLSCVQNFTKLSLEEQAKHNAALSLLAVFFQVSKTSSMRRIETAVSVMRKQLPFKETLAAFLTA